MTFKELLKSKGFSYRVLAEAIGSKTQTVYSWASGRCTPPPETILKINDILQVPAEEVLMCFVKTKEA